jgi:hypothetical protein
MGQKDQKQYRVKAYWLASEILTPLQLAKRQTVITTILPSQGKSVISVLYGSLFTFT